LRTKLKAAFFSNRWLLCGSVGLVTAAATFCITFMQTPDRVILKQFFEQAPLSNHTDTTNWGEPNETFNLMVFVIVKFILMVITISSPICSGVFYPTFLLGAGFGRLYGHILKLIIGEQIREASYAIIGAACVVSSVTRTVSVAMILFELNGELNYMIPVLFAVVIAYAISNNLSNSIFDVLLDMKDLPYLPGLRDIELYNQTAGDIMNTKFLYLTKQSRLKDIAVLLQSLGSRSKSIPVVESEDDKVLVYTVQAQSLRKYLFSCYSQISDELPVEIREQMNRYFSSLYSISQVKLSDFRKKAEPGTEEAYVQQFIQQISEGSQRNISADEDEMSNSKFNIHDRKQSVSFILEYSKQESLDKELQDKTFQTIQANFWRTKIDYSHEFLEVDGSPFTLMYKTPMSKVHFLFTMLGITQLFVTHRGIIVGIISKTEFLQANKVSPIKQTLGIDSGAIDYDHNPSDTQSDPSMDSHSLQHDAHSDSDISHDEEHKFTDMKKKI
jgi:chloride channel 2